MEFSDKETAIFNAVITLLNEGRDMYDIKASDIAAAAGVGKGSLYNYFGSKEEIISKALFYHSYSICVELGRLLDKPAGFRQKVRDALIYLYENAFGRNASLHILIFNLGGRDLLKLLTDNNEAAQQQRELGRSIIGRLYRCGADEGIFGQHDEAYIQCVFISAAMGFFSSCCGADGEIPNLDRALDFALEIIIKALA